MTTMTSKARAGAKLLVRDMAIGVLAALGQAPLGAWPLSLLGFGLALWWIARSPDTKTAFWRGLRIGAGYFAFSLSWIVQPFMVDPIRHGWMAPFALLGVSFGLGLFWGLAGAVGRRGGVIAVALALSLVELARGHVLTGFPWALPGHIWIETWFGQMGSLVGGYGMTALTLLALAAPLAWKGRGLVLTGAIAALAAGWSYHRLNLPQPEPLPGIVRLVQPNIEQSLKWDPQQAHVNFDTLRALTAPAGADLVIWPETAVPWLVDEGGPLALAISQAGGTAKVVTGWQRDEMPLAWNALGVFGPDGRIEQNFDKIHLVPFGEYMPMGDLLYRWFGLQAFASQVGAGYSAGQSRDLMQFGALGKALPLICYEAIFPEELHGPERADWMLQVTNDAWFGTLTGPYQHFALTRLRAIEAGMPLLRAANTGISAFIDARGHVAQGLSLPLGVQGVIEGQIPGAFAQTPYGKFGDWPIFGALILSLIIALKGRRLVA